MVNIDNRVFIYLAFLILAFPLPWTAAAITAAALHELGHLIAAKLLKGEIIFIRIHMTGAEIGAVFPGKMQEAIAALAGPAMSFLLVLLYQRTPKLAVCGFLQGMYNLMPVYPLDGGRALRCLGERFCPEWTSGICRWAEILTYLALAGIALWAVFLWKLDVWPVLMILLMISCKIRRKIPCKQRGIGVQ